MFTRGSEAPAPTEAFIEALRGPADETSYQDTPAAPLGGRNGRFWSTRQRQTRILAAGGRSLGFTPLVADVARPERRGRSRAASRIENGIYLETWFSPIGPGCKMVVELRFDGSGHQRGLSVCLLSAFNAVCSGLFTVCLPSSNTAR